MRSLIAPSMNPEAYSCSAHEHDFFWIHITTVGEAIDAPIISAAAVYAGVGWSLLYNPFHFIPVLHKEWPQTPSTRPQCTQHTTHYTTPSQILHFKSRPKSRRACFATSSPASYSGSPRPTCVVAETLPSWSQVCRRSLLSASFQGVGVDGPVCDDLACFRPAVELQLRG